MPSTRLKLTQADFYILMACSRCPLALQAVDRGKEVASEVKDTTEEISENEISVDEAADKVKDTAKEVYNTAKGNKSEE